MLPASHCRLIARVIALVTAAYLILLLSLYFSLSSLLPRRSGRLARMRMIVFSSNTRSCPLQLIVQLPLALACLTSSMRGPASRAMGRSSFWTLDNSSSMNSLGRPSPSALNSILSLSRCCSSIGTSAVMNQRHGPPSSSTRCSAATHSRSRFLANLARSSSGMQEHTSARTWLSLSTMWSMLVAVTWWRYSSSSQSCRMSQNTTLVARNLQVWSTASCSCCLHPTNRPSSTPSPPPPSLYVHLLRMASSTAVVWLSR
mmetsp:Transcript_6213/g.13560  ORF Transcript_6213/g.13560 Transcript_6213/m.13560 type:complete len:258 (-) Transcript_6213:238-1011(-)